MLFLFPSWVLCKQPHTDQLFMLFTIWKDVGISSPGLVWEPCFPKGRWKCACSTCGCEGAGQDLEDMLHMAEVKAAACPSAESYPSACFLPELEQLWRFTEPFSPSADLSGFINL